MTINDKIKQILIDKNFTPSYFADEIGVQRSSISHILSGRNRPSFDIIQKIIRRFPELGYDWIMEEDNQVNNTTVMNGYPSRGNVSRLSSDRYKSPDLSYVPNGIRSQRNEIPPVTPNPASPAEQATAIASEQTQATTSEKKVERILVFYADGSFREFTPTA
ncbi:helix-turn-helix transcriptional regulator [Spirosoma validum]|uniref:Helix-turn-helix transcriptional regulator n=1 Tax=Spirosoma validum TaxID=2771355 RepID=A0A927B2H8_9BACT|nr:helix-turn-helix transcriptional regulator [Spirosoma validum]MBD2754400.1 helix-turn-helix transcriptional regulator [Spirosoma validum]